VTTLRAGRPRFRIPEGARGFCVPQNIRTVSGAHPASYSVGTGFFFLGVNRPWREVDHSPPSTAELKNEWSHTSAPTVCLYDVRTDRFTFYSIKLLVFIIIDIMCSQRVSKDCPKYVSCSS
jgi:hypothetical protein